MTLSGSVWIGLILLKLKTYCWNHCSKIIFKCVNSAVGPIFNEKIDKKWNLWVHEQCTNALFTEKVNICGYCSLNSSRTPPKTREKKKKKKEQNANVVYETWIQTEAQSFSPHSNYLNLKFNNFRETYYYKNLLLISMYYWKYI